MKCSIIINAFRIPRESVLQAERIKLELEALGVSADIVDNGFSRVTLRDGNISHDFTDDFIVYLDKDKYLSEALERSGMRLFNRHDAVRVCDDKAQTYIALAGRGIQMPNTLFGALCFRPDCELSLDNVVKIENEIGYPVIVKESFGSMGKGVYKANNRAELIALMEKVKLKPHLFQKFIPTASGRDVRIIVIGGKAVAAMERRNDTDFRSNIAAGGSGVAITPSEEFVVLAEKAARLLGLDYCGVDLLYGENGRPVLCEVNSNAFFLGMEKATGINVARLYAQYMISVIN